MKRLDVVVVGAGPAGLFTAVHLHPTLEVLVIDRQRFPPTKPCGELLVDHGYRILGALNPPDYVFATPMNVAVRLIDRNLPIPPRIPGNAHTLNRRALARWIMSLAGTNVTFREQTRFLNCRRIANGFSIAMRRANGKTEWISTNCLVGADGHASDVRRAVFATRADSVEAIQCTYATQTALASADFILDSVLAPGFYMWVFPRADDRILIGCLVGNGNYRKAVAWARAEYDAGTTVLRRERHPITRINSLDDLQTGRGNLILVGEAAGFVRPTSGEGISLALESGRAAAFAINADPGSPARAYSEACRPIVEVLAREIDNVQELRREGGRFAEG